LRRGSSFHGGLTVRTPGRPLGVGRDGAECFRPDVTRDAAHAGQFFHIDAEISTIYAGKDLLRYLGGTRHPQLR
jgi:hypothetical protein